MRFIQFSNAGKMAAANIDKELSSLSNIFSMQVQRMETTLDASLVTQSINYHGQQLQKTWEAERGEDDLVKIGVGALDFAVYQSRHKHLTFQDRSKRLKLHQFIAKEASALFDASLMEEAPSSSSLGTDSSAPEDSKCSVNCLKVAITTI